jgi:hypothetical protein
MRLVSSAFTGFHKLFTLLILTVGSALFAIGAICVVVFRNEPFFLLFPIVFIAFGTYSWRRMARLVDSVCLDGSDLVVQNKDNVERVPLRQVLGVESHVFFNPERIVLTLREPCRFGETIGFLPPVRLFRLPFSPHPLAAELNDLIRRVTSPDLHASGSP